MKPFKQRVISLINDCNLGSVKESCSFVYDNSFNDDKSLRKLTLERLNSIKEHSSLINEFLTKERKVDLYENLMLNQIFTYLRESEAVTNNAFVVNAITTLEHSLNNTSPAFVIENAVYKLNEFQFIPEVKNAIDTFNNIIKENEVEITLIRTSELLKKSPNSTFYNQLREMIDGYIYDEKYTVQELIGEMTKYKFEPILSDVLVYLNKTSGNNLYLKESSQFNINPVYSFVTMLENDSKVVYNNGVYYSVDGDTLKTLSENEYLQLADDYKVITKFMDSNNVYVDNGILHYKADAKNTVSFNATNEGKFAYLNNKIIESETPLQFIAQTGVVLDGKIINVLNKVWENIYTLVDLDFAKEVESKVYAGLNATLFKLDENYFVHLANPAMHVNSFTNGTCLQMKNMIIEHMGYDISETLYEFLEGDESKIAKLRNEQNGIRKAIEDLNEQLKKIDNAVANKVIPQEKLEESNVREIILSQIDKLHDKFNNINLTIIKMQNANDYDVDTNHYKVTGSTFADKYTADSGHTTSRGERNKIVTNKLNDKISKGRERYRITEAEDEIIKDSGSLKVNDQVRLKGTGTIAKVTGINTVTGVVSLVNDEGHTIEVTKDDVEIIKDQLADQLSDIEKFAKKASDELKVKQNESRFIQEDMKSFDRTSGATGTNGGKIMPKSKVITAKPNSDDDIIQMAKDAAMYLKKKL